MTTAVVRRAVGQQPDAFLHLLRYQFEREAGVTHRGEQSARQSSAKLAATPNAGARADNAAKGFAEMRVVCKSAC
jgi:hypothetical protein